MHDTSIENGTNFIKNYIQDKKGTLVEIGSKTYGTSFSFKKIISPENINYIGIDFQSGTNVDIVIGDPYEFPLENGSVDWVISSSCFEHSEFFWLTFNEIMRILKPGGLLYLNTPSNGAFHRFPVDCWRFYPDSASSLAKWARRNNFDCHVLEQFTSLRKNDIWFDHVAIFIKGNQYSNLYPNRITDNFKNCINYSTYPDLEDFKNYSSMINISQNPF